MHPPRPKTLPEGLCLTLALRWSSLLGHHRLELGARSAQMVGLRLRLPFEERIYCGSAEEPRLASPLSSGLFSMGERCSGFSQ